jgi:hypothetical protein
VDSAADVRTDAVAVLGLAAVATEAAVAVDPVSGAMPQVSQYPSTMVPGQSRWQFMTGHPS